MSDREATREQILQSVEKFNAAFRCGTGFKELGPLLHDDVVLTLPGFVARVKGREACLKAYEDTCSQMKIEKLDASDEHVDVYGAAAVVSSKYNCTWEYHGKRLDDEGHEIMVFVQDGEDWRMVWRTLIPGSRRIEGCPTQQAQTAQPSGMDVRQLCLNILSTNPVCDLATIDEQGFPHVTVINNLRCAKEYPNLVKLHEASDNPFTVYMSTNMQSHKIARMQANPRASVSFCDEVGRIGFMLGGEIEIITDQDLKHRVWQKGWTMFYPGGPESPEYGLIRLAPRVVEGWCRNHRFEIRIPS
jgi:general stress protein 26/ketosteroid isomerase-like protein